MVFVLAGDEDRHLQITHGKNAGRVKAQEAALATGGKALFPVFAPGENSYPAYLAPVTPEMYRAHQRTGATLTNPQRAALDHMKRHTDFNDLATRSTFGQEGVDRQVRTAVEEIVAKCGARIEDAQTFMQQPRRAVRIG